MTNRSNLPHPLRLTIFLLRITLGLNFFYLGFSTLFNTVLGRELGARALASLYQGIDISAFQTFLQWAFLVIGACLVIGLFTRSVSVVGIALTLAVYFPTVNFASLSAPQFINDEIIVIMCLLVLIFSGAGTYLGADNFIHVHFARQHKKAN